MNPTVCVRVMPWFLLCLVLFIIFFNGFSDGIWSMNVKIVVLQEARSSFKHYLINERKDLKSVRWCLVKTSVKDSSK